MRKRRIISLLLSAALIISSLPVTAYAAGGTPQSDNTFTAADGQQISLVTTDDDTYISVTGRDNSEDIITYTDTTGNYTKGTSYTISFKARTKPYIASTTLAANYPAIYDIYNGSYDGSDRLTRYELKSDWQTITFDTEKFAGVLYFRGFALGYSVAPYDIKDLTITETGSDTNLAANTDGLYANGAGWAIFTDKKEGVKVLDIFSTRDYDYLEIPASLDGNTSFKYTSTEYLEAGVYHISGDFILNEAIDYNKYTFASDTSKLTADDNGTAALTVSAGGNTLRTLDGKASIELGQEKWTGATYTLVVSDSNAVRYSDIVFTADGAVAVCVRNIKIEDKSSQYDTTFTTADGQLISSVTTEDDTSYISVTGRDNSEDIITYTDTTGNYTKGTSYTISFKARTKPYIASTTINSYPAIYDIYNGSYDGSDRLFRYTLTSDWQTITFDTEKFAGVLYFRGFALGYSVAPYDIKDLTITETGSDTNLAANTDGLYANGAGWAIFTDKKEGVKVLEISSTRDYDHLEIPASTTGNTSFNYTSDEYLEAGVYHISGDFILNEAIDYNKYTFASDTSKLTADDNGTAALTVSAGGTTLRTFDGKASIELGQEKWTGATYTLVVSDSNAVRYSDIVFTADGAVAVCVRNIKIEDKSSQYDTTFTTADGQLISSVTTEDDTSYISVTGRDNGEDWITYADTTKTYTKGTSYTISFKARTKPYIASTTIASNPAIYRVYNGGWDGDYLSDRYTLTSDWQTITMVTDKFAGTLYFRGFILGYSVAPYDIKDLTITETGSDTNLAVNTDGLYANGAGWAIHTNRGAGVKDLEVFPTRDYDYLEIPASLDGNTSFSYTSDEYLEAGVYHISGDFILNEAIDYNKYTFAANDAATLTEDANSTAALTVSANGTTLKTLDGRTSLTLSPEKWTGSTTFKLIVEKSNTVKYSDIAFLADGALPIGVRNYAVTDMSANYGGDWESNDGELVENVTENGESFARTETHDTDTYLAYNGQDTIGAGVWLLKSKFRLNTADDAASALLTATLNGEPINAFLGESSLEYATDFTVTNDGWCEAAFVITLDSAVMKSDVRLQIDSGYSLEFGEIEFVNVSEDYDTGVLDGMGNHPIKISGSGEQYISFDGRADISDKLIYNVKGLETGTYSIAFTARTKPYIESSTIGNRPAMIRAKFNQNHWETITLTPEWVKYGPYTASDFAGVVELFGSAYGCGFAPFDVKDIVITKAGESKNLAVNASGKLQNGNGWSISETREGTLKSLSLSLLADDPYYRILTPDVGNTEITFTGDEMLEPGVYHITGNFRLGEPIDYNKYEINGVLLTADGNAFKANLGASAGGVTLLALSGDDSATISDVWNKVTFVLDIAVPINKSDITFMLDDALILEYYDFGIELIEKKINIADVNMSFVITLLALKLERAEAYGLNAPWNGLTSVDKVLDETTGESGAKDGAVANAYIHFSGRDHNEDLLVYENKGRTLAPGIYTVSFWGRGAKAVSAPSPNPLATVRLFFADNRTMVTAASVNSLSSNHLLFGEDWRFFSITFKIDAAMPLKFMFRGSGLGGGWGSLDIDGFSVTAEGAPEENLAVNTGGLMNSSGAGWTAENVVATSIIPKVEKLTESAYMTTDSGAENTVITSGGAKIKPGKYYITAKVRLAAFDYKKFVFDNGMAYNQNNNVATLVAALAGNILKTTEGEESFTVTPEWGTVSFVMDVEKETPMSRIKLMLDSNADLDFDYINIDTEVNTLDEDALAPGQLPPLTADAANLLDGAVSAERLEYWDIGDQTLEAKTDENGETYFAASNITSNTRGFIYKPGFTIQPGIYKLTGQVRTTNEGEEGMLRAMIGDGYASTPLTNEWRSIELRIIVDKEMEFEFKLRGGPYKTSIEDYEFKNLTLANIYYVDAGVNVFADSGFDGADALSRWRFGYDTGKLTINTEDGNSYLTVSDRGASDTPAVVNTGFVMIPGDTYTISYDIRTSDKGETMHVRVGTGLHSGAVVHHPVSDYVNDNPILNEITDTWEHVEHTFTATGNDYLYIWFRGGSRGALDNKSFDIDNLVIMRKDTK